MGFRKEPGRKFKGHASEISFYAARKDMRNKLRYYVVLTSYKSCVRIINQSIRIISDKNKYNSLLRVTSGGNELLSGAHELVGRYHDIIIYFACLFAGSVKAGTH